LFTGKWILEENIRELWRGNFELCENLLAGNSQRPNYDENIFDREIFNYRR